MIEKQIAKSAVAGAFVELSKYPIWGAKLGFGSFLTFEFGGEPDHDLHGLWHLWIYYCGWVLERNGEVVCSAENERQEIEQAIAKLNGRKIANFSCEERNEFIFSFEGGFSLRTRPASIHQRAEFWMLYYSNKSVISAKIDGFFLEVENDQP